MTSDEKLFYKAVLGVLTKIRNKKLKDSTITINKYRNNVLTNKDRMKEAAETYRRQIPIIKFLSKHKADIPVELAQYLTESITTKDQAKLSTLDFLYAKKKAEEDLKNYEGMLNQDNRKIRGIIYSEYERIQDFIKDGIIESVEYDPKLGINIVFPGRMYRDRYFTGKIQVTICDQSVCQVGVSACKIFKFSSLSYKDQPLTSYHYTNVTNQCGAFCPGSFRELFDQAFYSKLLSQLIMTLDLYLDSVDVNNRYNGGPTSDIRVLDEKGPKLKLLDKSWEEFKLTEKYQDWTKTDFGKIVENTINLPPSLPQAEVPF